jgi:hypothetical protein
MFPDCIKIGMTYLIEFMIKYKSFFYPEVFQPGTQNAEPLNLEGLL